MGHKQQSCMWDTHRTSVHAGRSLGTLSSERLLQSTSVPRHEHLDGHACRAEPEIRLNMENQTVTKHSTVLCGGGISVPVVQNTIAHIQQNNALLKTARGSTLTNWHQKKKANPQLRSNQYNNMQIRVHHDVNMNNIDGYRSRNVRTSGNVAQNWEELVNTSSPKKASILTIAATVASCRQRATRHCQISKLRPALCFFFSSSFFVSFPSTTTTTQWKWKTGKNF